ncbi:TPA: hypothetical protein ACH3X2_004142 [Trebouxia sp. C0005]
MRPRRRARGPPGLTQEGNFDRAQRRKLAAENRAAKHANRENSQPARTNQAPADDANREDGQPASAAAIPTARSQAAAREAAQTAAAQAIAAQTADAQAAQAAAQAEAQTAAALTTAAQTAVAQAAQAAAAQATAAQTAAAQARPFPLGRNRLPLPNIGTQRLGQYSEDLFSRAGLKTRIHGQSA